MAKFTFQVDRIHRVVAPFKVHPDVGLMSEPFELGVDQRVVYRGLVELGGTNRYVFEVQGPVGPLEAGQKAYSRDLPTFENALEEDFGALIRP